MADVTLRKVVKRYDEVEAVRGVFFFQAEDGIRVRTVTGVQTCALPIFGRVVRRHLDAGRRRRLADDLADEVAGPRRPAAGRGDAAALPPGGAIRRPRRRRRRSEERRVGEWWWGAVAPSAATSHSVALTR